MSLSGRELRILFHSKGKPTIDENGFVEAPVAIQRFSEEDPESSLPSELRIVEVLPFGAEDYNKRFVDDLNRKSEVTAESFVLSTAKIKVLDPSATDRVEKNSALVRDEDGFLLTAVVFQPWTTLNPEFEVAKILKFGDDEVIEKHLAEINRDNDEHTPPHIISAAKIKVLDL